MKPTIRRINARYRGPMESQKHEMFYQSLQAAIEELKETYHQLEETFEPIKTATLLRHHTTDVSVFYPKPSELIDGIGITYPYQGDDPRIQRVGVLDKTLKQKGGFEFSPAAGITRHAQRILILDELSTGSIETKIPATPTPLEVALTIQSDLADLKKESL